MIAVVMGARFTRTDYERLPEGFPAQLVRGTLVKEPSPTYGHQRLVHLLLERLSACVGRDRVVPAPMDVGLDDHNVYQPDILVAHDDTLTERHLAHPPALAVEILSPSSRSVDLVRKRAAYERAGLDHPVVVEPLLPAVTVLARVGRRLVEVAAAKGDEPLAVERPFPVTVVAADLVA